MSGISRSTFMPIGNLDSALQSVELILSTRLGERIMRREFGAGFSELLGRLTTPTLFAAFQMLIATAIDLWEPRFSVRRVVVGGSADDLRLGRASLWIEVDYLPRGHLGDPRVERVLQFGVSFDGNGINVT